MFTSKKIGVPAIQRGEPMNARKMARVTANTPYQVSGANGVSVEARGGQWIISGAATNLRVVDNVFHYSASRAAFPIINWYHFRVAQDTGYVYERIYRAATDDWCYLPQSHYEAIVEDP